MAKSSAVPKRSDRETMLSFRVPRDLHERLKEAADRQGIGLSTEIRRRLEASLAGTLPETPTRGFGQLLAAINDAAPLVAHLRPQGDPQAAAIFQQAVIGLALAYRDSAVKQDHDVRSDVVGAVYLTLGKVGAIDEAQRFRDEGVRWLDAVTEMLKTAKQGDEH